MNNTKHLDIELEESPYNDWAQPETKSQLPSNNPFVRAANNHDTNNAVAYSAYSPIQNIQPNQPERRASVPQEQQQVLQKQYESFVHYNYVNIAMIAITAISGLIEIFMVIALSDDDEVCEHIHSKEHKIRECKKDPEDFFTDEKTRNYFMGLFVVYIIVAKIVLGVIYFAGKYAYGQKNDKIFKVLLITYGVLILLSLLGGSFFGVIIFAYLAFCAWKIREILQKFDSENTGSCVVFA